MSTEGELNSLLLLAAFAEPERALAAWTQWQQQSDWQRAVDFDAYLLLPQVYHNLGGRDVEDALFKRLKGVLKRNWLANTATLTAIGRILQSLQSIDISAVLLPPAASLLVDRSMALESGAAIACRISRCDAQRAVQQLLASGWRITAPAVPQWCLPGYIAGSRCLRLRTDDMTLDLQWVEGVDASTRSATAIRFREQAIYTLDIVASIHLLLTVKTMGTDLARIGRALLLLHKHNDLAGWHCLLGELRHSNSAYAETVASLCPLTPEDVVRDEGTNALRIQPEKPGSGEVPAASLLLHYRQRWQHYRAALGEGHSMLAAMRCLPGYLMGRWELSQLREVVPHFYSAAKYQWRRHQAAHSSAG